jgi:hypothetical protein
MPMQPTKPVNTEQDAFVLSQAFQNFIHNHTDAWASYHRRTLLSITSFFIFNESRYAFMVSIMHLA